MKNILTGLLFLLSLVVYAKSEAPSLICNSEDLNVIKNLVYTEFMNTYPTKKYQYPYVYQAANSATETSITSDCGAGKSDLDIIDNSYSACRGSCDEVGTNFFQGFRKDQKSASLILECKSSCLFAKIEFEKMVITKME